MCIDVPRESAAAASDARASMLLAGLRTTIPSRVDMAIDIEGALAIPSHVSRLLRLLLRNAIEAMPRGGPLELALNHQAKAERRTHTHRVVLALRCTDHGLGMTPLMVRQVFDDSDISECWGRALVERLRIVRRLTQAHGGQLCITSTLGYGARVQVDLPEAIDLDAAANHARPPIDQAA